MSTKESKKINVIIGPARSGKTKLARNLAETLPKEQVVFLPGRRLYQFEPFMFTECTTETTLVIIDDVVNISDFIFFLSVTHSKIQVEKRGEKPFTISPEIILTCDESITREELDAMGSLVSNRCIIYEMMPETLPELKS